jgi:O-antigen/teichoic acid export membrane protein
VSFFKGTAIYLFSNIFNAAIPFLLLPILTRHLSPLEYGQIAMFQILLTGLSSFIGLNSNGSADRKFYDKNCNSQYLKEFNGSCLQILIFSTIFLLILLLFSDSLLSDFLSIPISWIYYSITVSFFAFFIKFRLGQWQVRGCAISYGLLQISQSLINMLLSLLLVVKLGEGAEGRIDAQIYTSCVVGMVSIGLLYRDKLVSIFSWKVANLIEALKFGVPLVPHHLGFFLLAAIDRLIVNKELGLEDAGIYMVAVQFSMGLMMCFDAINKAYVPWLFQKLKNDNEIEKKKIVKLTYLYFSSLLILIPILLLIMPKIVVLIVGEGFSKAGEVVGILCVGQVFGGMYLMVTNYIFYAKKTGRLSLVTIISGIINVIFLIIFVKHYGLVGAGLSFVLAKFCQFSLTWMLASKCVDMPWLSFHKSEKKYD